MKLYCTSNSTHQIFFASQTSTHEFAKPLKFMDILAAWVGNVHVTVHVRINLVLKVKVSRYIFQFTNAYNIIYVN